MELVVQHVRTSWTKLSRGGAEAARRNAAPVAYPLPTRAATFVQHVLHDEEAEFVATTTVDDLPPHASGTRWRDHELLVLDDDGRLRVELTPSAWGMPRRHRRPPAVRLAPGEWLRWQINSRLIGSADGHWHYRLDTFNVSCGSPAGINVFLSEPTHHIDERAYLR